VDEESVLAGKDEIEDALNELIKSSRFKDLRVHKN